MKVEIYNNSSRGDIIYGNVETIIKNAYAGKSLVVVKNNVLKYVITKCESFGNEGKRTSFRIQDFLTNHVTIVEDFYSHPIYKELINES